MTRSRLVAVVLILSSVTLFAQRTKLKPGTNMFSPQQDIELGQQVARDAEKQNIIIADRVVSDYISALGQKLAAAAPNEYKFPFTFKVVDDRSINAFALPGGPVFVHRGAIEAADNEAQIAGVIGHEIGHVILRHGTNQATKAQYAQLPLAVLGGVLGNGTAGKVLAQLGGFAASGVLLRYSRDAETQSDLMGTQILYDLRYEPRAMAQFFEKLAKEDKGGKAEQFFSNHPIPENRVTNVNNEISKIGAVPANPKLDTPEFQRVKKILLAMPDTPKPAPKPAASSAPANNGKPAAPEVPSTRLVDFQIAGVSLRHPANWQPAVQGSNAMIAPAGGVIGQGNLAYGMMVDIYKPQSASTLDVATRQFLDELRKGNPSMKVVRANVRNTVGGRAALLNEVTNESPAGGTETDWVVTVLVPSGELRTFVMVAPSPDFARYQPVFRAILDSVRLK